MSEDEKKPVEITVHDSPMLAWIDPKPGDIFRMPDTGRTYRIVSMKSQIQWVVEEMR